MRRRTALFGFGIIIFLVGYKLSGDPAYKAATTGIRLAAAPSPLLLADSATEAFNPGRMYAQTFSTRIARATSPLADSLISFARTLMGHRYRSGGNQPGGFDCSGYTHYIYSRFGLDVPHGSVNQAVVGEPVPLQQARKGDLLIFTGTNLQVREPGHVGIVITETGEPVEFIHSSSNGGVKISRVPGTRYAERLLQVRRVL